MTLNSTTAATSTTSTRCAPVYHRARKTSTCGCSHDVCSWTPTKRKRSGSAQRLTWLNWTTWTPISMLARVRSNLRRSSATSVFIWIASCPWSITSPRSQRPATRLRQIRRCVSKEVTIRLVLALVRLDYCNSLLAGLPQSRLAPLQRVQPWRRKKIVQVGLCLIWCRVVSSRVVQSHVFSRPFVC